MSNNVIYNFIFSIIHYLLETVATCISSKREGLMPWISQIALNLPMNKEHYSYRNTTQFRRRAGQIFEAKRFYIAN